MRRREFLGVLGGAAAVWPLAARAQQGERMRRIAILMPFPPSNTRYQVRVRLFREELRKKGWASGVNAQFDERWTTDNLELIRSAAANLVELKPDVILSVGGRVIPILQELTRVIPIVVPGGSNPVEAGWIENLARPGGNITGFAIMELSVHGKMLQTLKDLAPQVSRVGFIYNPDNPAAAHPPFISGAEPIGIESIIFPVRNLTDIDRERWTSAVAKG